MSRIDPAPSIDPRRFQETLLKSLEDRTPGRAGGPSGRYSEGGLLALGPVPPPARPGQVDARRSSGGSSGCRGRAARARCRCWQRAESPSSSARPTRCCRRSHRIDTRENPWRAARVAGPDTAFRLMAAIDEAHHSQRDRRRRHDASAIPGADPVGARARARGPSAWSSTTLRPMERMDEWCAGPVDSGARPSSPGDGHDRYARRPGGRRTASGMRTTFTSWTQRRENPSSCPRRRVSCPTG